MAEQQVFALLQGSRHLCCHKAGGVSAATRLQAYVLQQSSRCLRPRGGVFGGLLSLLWPYCLYFISLTLFHSATMCLTDSVFHVAFS